MADYNLGTARGRIEIDGSGAEEGTQEAEKALGGLAGAADKHSAGLKQSGTVIAGVGATIAAGFVLAVASASSFEQRMSAVQAVSGATSDEMQQLSDKALQLGKDTSFSATDAASAIEELVKAGVAVPDVLNGAADAVVNLAAAGEIALPEAATIAANAMNAFKISAEEMPHIADLIAGAANASAIDVGEFGQSMSQVSAVAALAGLSFDDTAVAIAEMGNAGIKGSDAGTSLKSMLMNLQPTTEAASNAMSDLGLILEDGSNAFYDAEGNTKSLAEIQGLLQNATKDLTAEQKTMALETIFGSDAIRAAAVLADNGSAGYDKLAGAMGSVTAEQVAQTRLGNTAGSWEQLKGSLETVAITIGQMLLPALKSIIDFVTQVVNWFQNLSDGNKKVVVIITAVVAAITLLVGGLLLLVGTFAPVIAGLIAMTAAEWAALAPILLIVLAVVAVIAIIVVLAVIIVKNWDKIKAWTIDTFNTIKEFIMMVWASIVSFFTSTLASIQAVWQTVWGAISTFFTTIWNALVAALTWYINLYVTIITTVLNFLKGIWEAFWGVFGGVITAVWELIVAAVELYITLMMFVIRTVLDAIQSLWETVWGAITDFFTAVWEGIVAAVTWYINLVLTIITTVFNAINTFITTIFNAVASFVSSVWSRIYNAVSGPVSSIWNTITSVFGQIVGYVTGVFTGAYNAAKTQWDAIWTLISGFKDKVVGYFSGAASWLYDAGKNIIQGLIDGVTNMIKSLTDKLKSITDLIPKNKGPENVDKKLLTPNGKLIIQSLIAGLEKELPGLWDTLSGVTTGIPLAVSANSTNTLPPSSVQGNGPAKVVNITIETFQASDEVTTEQQALAMLRTAAERADV